MPKTLDDDDAMENHLSYLTQIKTKAKAAEREGGESGDRVSKLPHFASVGKRKIPNSECRMIYCFSSASVCGVRI